MNQSRLWNNRQGMSIIEVMVSFGIMSIMALGMVSMIQSQNKEVTALTEKLLAKDVEAHLVNVMNVSDFCSCLMRGLTLNTTTAPMTLSANPVDIPAGYTQPIPVPLTTACTPSSAVRIVPSAGNRLENSNLRINAITYSDISALGNSKYSANLNVSFQLNSGVRPINNVKSAVIFTVNGADPANAQRFQACGAAVPAAAVTFQSGSYNAIACHANICCYTVVYPLAFPVATKSAVITPNLVDFGHHSNDITPGINWMNNTGFQACFDHRGNTLDNNFTFFWMATGN